MKVSYDLISEKNSFEQNDLDDISKINFLLTNNKGDFLNFGGIMNFSKFQGFYICDKSNSKLFKIVDEILPKNVDIEEIEYLGYKVNRKFSSKFAKDMGVPILGEGVVDSNLDEGKLSYDERGILKEFPLEDDRTFSSDSMYLGPSGGIVYQISDFEGRIFLDLDCKEFLDFDNKGKNYNVYEKKGIVFVEFEKKSEDLKSEYKLYFGVKASNFLYNLEEVWVEKEYVNSKNFVFRFMEILISGDKKLFFGAGCSEEEVISQISLLELHQEELEKFDEEIYFDLMKKSELFSKPIPQDVKLAYSLSINGLYKFLNRDVDNKINHSQIQSAIPNFPFGKFMDEMIAIRAFINLGEYLLVKEKLLKYLNEFDFKKDEDRNFTNYFWLVKRFTDFVFVLDEKGDLSGVFSSSELKFVYDKFSMIFNRVVKDFWDFDKELLKVKKGDSWMKDVHLDYPLEFQVQFLEFTSSLAIFAGFLNVKEDVEHYLDLENLLREKIRADYWRGGFLYSDLFEDRIDCNVFLAYYFYPDLFLSEDWESIFDVALSHLRTSWGGVSSLSRKDDNFKENSQEGDDDSKYFGDSWFWINNIVAIVLNDLNERKYRADIAKILNSSTKDILTRGTVGFGSEISSSSLQTAEGSLAKLISSSTYIELVEKLFDVMD